MPRCDEVLDVCDNIVGRAAGDVEDGVVVGVQVEMALLGERSGDHGGLVAIVDAEEVVAGETGAAAGRTLADVILESGGVGP